MEVYYQAVIVVGLRIEDIENVKLLFDKDDDLVDGLKECTSYYDGGGDEGNVIGIVVAKSPDYGNSELESATLLEDIETAKMDFKRLTGQDAKVYLSMSGW